MTRDFDISQLSPAERILLVEELWDSLAAEANCEPISPEQLSELNRRLDALESGEIPPGEPWEVVRKRLFLRRQSESSLRRLRAPTSQMP